MRARPDAGACGSHPAAAGTGRAARPARAGWIHTLIALVWALALLAGMGFLWRYKSTSRPRGEEATAWPEASRLPVARDEPTLVLFAHPECPCTRTSILVLREFLPLYAERVTACVAALRPAVPPTGWSEAGLQDSVGSLPGVTLCFDLEGREARLFGATTSGHVVLFAAGGKLLFSGGITGARGHAGDNPGLQALEHALVAELAGHEPGAPALAPVFGCSLLDPEPCAPEATE